MSKNLDGHVRITAAEKAVLVKLGMGFSRAFRVGLDTLKVWIQSEASHSCVYLYNTGENPAPPASAPLLPSEPIAHGCPCLACPIRAAFAGRAACGQLGHERDRSELKENEPAGPVLLHEMETHPAETAEDPEEAVA